MRARSVVGRQCELGADPRGNRVAAPLSSLFMSEVTERSSRTLPAGFNSALAYSEAAMSSIFAFARAGARSVGAFIEASVQTVEAFGAAHRGGRAAPKDHPPT